ncbi:YphA family membrane protein [Metabacillus schmidteae]|uniref:YphA family membrane protein n=1 Tax=Metabacillus schmidteae TaxID=2730405 RepID=UPI00158F4108|nr:hypothetical protein [Metabacillus schmidteae]
MEGIFFYWIMWLVWIFTTFMMDKNKKRLTVSIFILISILLSKWYLVISTYSINMTLLFFLFLGYYLAVNLNKLKLVSFYLTSLSLTFAYSGIMLFRIYDPVWFIFDVRFIIGFIISILAIYLGRTSIERFSLYVISLCQGECLYWIVLGQFHDVLTFGTQSFLDMLSIGCLIIFLWSAVQHLTIMMENSIGKLQKTTKEKQG